MCAARKDTLTGEPNRGGRPRTLKEEHVLALKEIVAEQPGATLEVVTQLLAEHCGVKVCSLTVRLALQEAGVVRVKPTRRAVEGGLPAKPGRYGYTLAHRREAAGSGYGCCMTDAEWALVADLFKHRAGGRGMPPQLDRRTLVDACCYVLRTGCAWRLLPRSFPAWPKVYKSFSRWAAQGVFESMQDRLRQQWRERLGRPAQPSPAQRSGTGFSIHKVFAPRGRGRFRRRQEGQGAAAVSSCITTARSPPPPHGCGLPRPRSSARSKLKCNTAMKSTG
jgi:transposase